MGNVFRLVMRCVALVCAVEMTSVASVAQPRRAPLPLAEALRFQVLGNRYRVSSDGRLVAFTTQDLSRRRLFSGTYSNSGLEGQDVWIADMAGAPPVRLEGGSSWSPVWSPDSRRLAFISDRDGANHLWVWDRANGRSRRVSTVPIRQYGNAGQFTSWSYLQWTSDGREVLAKVVPEGMTEADVESFVHEPSGAATRRALGESAVTELHSDGSTAEANGQLAQANARQKVMFGDLALIHVETGVARRIASRVQASRYDLSPDGTAVAYLNAKGQSPYDTTRVYDLVVADVQTGRTRTLARDVLQSVVGMQLTWSPDSHWIAYVGGTPTAGHLRLASRADDRDIPLLPLSVTDGYYGDQILPVWDQSLDWLYVAGPRGIQRVKASGGDREVVFTASDGERIAKLLTTESGRLWSLDNRSLAVAVESADRRTRTLARVDLGTGQRTNAPAAADEADHNVAAQEASMRATSVIYSSESATRPRDLWVATPDGKRRRISRTNGLFEEYELGKPRVIEWRNSDGAQRRGALLLPAGYEEERRCPLIVWVYGGDLLSEQITTFGLGGPLNNAHIYATRGYCVLFPDSPVSVGAPMADIAKNVLPGIDRVVDLGIADPSRIGVMGHSYGGYSALALITQTTRFKAAVSYAGLGNLLSAYGLMDDNGTAEHVGSAEQGQLSMGGSPWTYRERYIENSPLMFLDRVETPVLLVVGEQDNLWIQSDEVFIGLRRLGKTATYAKYAGVGHTIAYHPALLDHWERLLAWFDRYLVGKTGDRSAQ